MPTRTTRRRAERRSSRRAPRRVLAGHLEDDVELGRVSRLASTCADVARAGGQAASRRWASGSVATMRLDAELRSTWISQQADRAATEDANAHSRYEPCPGRRRAGRRPVAPAMPPRHRDRIRACGSATARPRHQLSQATVGRAVAGKCELTTEMRRDRVGTGRIVHTARPGQPRRAGPRLRAGSQLRPRSRGRGPAAARCTASPMPPSTNQ